MKPTSLLLLAALTLPALNPSALAQTAPDPAPVPVVVPALPPASSDPAAPTESAPVPTDAPATAVLRLTARPGTYAEYTTSLQVKFQLLDMHFETQPGKTGKAADLATLNARAKGQMADMNATLNNSGLSQTGKSFVRVKPPVNGNSVVLTTTILSLPDTLHPGKTRPVSVGITLTSDPSGRIVNAAVTSSDSQMQKLYQAMDLQTLIQNAQSSGSGSLYGQPLVAGQPVTRDSTTDAQRMMQSIIGSAITAAQTAQVQARPLVMHGVTTYTGKDAQGQLLFSRKVSAEPWNITLTLNGLAMQMAVTAITGGGSSVVRPDGLSQSETAEQTMAMQMDMPGEPYRMVMKVQYSLSTAVTLKKITLP